MGHATKSGALEIPELPILPATELSDRARAYAGAAMAANTKRAYAAQMRLWREHVGADRMFPADPTAVANWLAQRADAGQSVSTLRTAVAALRAGSIAAGRPLETRHPSIIHVLKGIGRTGRRAPQQKEPLRGVDLLQVIARIGTKPIDLRDAALLATAYAFGMRRSEVVGLDLGKLGDGDAFVRVTPRAIELTVAHSKTNANGEADVVTVPREQNGEVVRLLDAWVRHAGIEPGTALFRSVTKAGIVTSARLPDDMVALIIKKRVRYWLRSTGYRAEEAETAAAAYAGHSLRIGFATSAAEAGADLRAIASVTRHRSLDMPRRYAQRANQLLTSPHRLADVGLARK